MRVIILSALAVAGIIGCGDASSRPSPCHECRQQNAPIESAVTKSIELTQSGGRFESPKAVVADSALDINPGISIIDLEQSSRVQPSDSLRKATDALISQQENEI